MEEVSTKAPLEDRDDHTEGGGDREEEAQSGLDGHQDRAEYRNEKHDGEAHDDDAEGNQRGLNPRRDVHTNRCHTRHG